MLSWWRRIVKASLRWLMRHGRQPWAIPVLAAVASADSLLPMMPAEVLAVALFILQPMRVRLIFVMFAGAAALSALLLALAVSGATAAANHVDSGASHLSALAGPGWEQAKALVQTWGAPVLAFSALFPDSPRASIVVATLSGLPPLAITAWVLVGKLVLYGALAWGVVRLPQWSRNGRLGQGPVGIRLQRMNRRLLALRRLLSRAPLSALPTGQAKPP
jgi:membrane protein YqaA with SNARE-associated domain